MPFNGPQREFSKNQEVDEEKVYCVECGTIFVRARNRDCPICTLVEKIEEQSGT